jgi:hypothetical protein
MRNPLAPTAERTATVLRLNICTNATVRREHRISTRRYHRFNELNFPVWLGRRTFEADLLTCA